MNDIKSPAEESGFTIVIRERGGTWHATIAELGLIEQGTDIAQVTDSLRRRANETVAAFRAAGLESELPDRLQAACKSAFGEFRPLIVRSSIVASFAAFLIVIAGFAANYVIATNAQRFVAMFEIGRNAMRPVSLARDLANGVTELSAKLQSMPPEQKERVLGDIRVLVEQARPVIREIQSALDGGDAPLKAPPAAGQ